MKPLFLLDPDVVFLNHGSFGACPVPVFEAYQAWQRRLERQPVQFLGVEFNDHMKAARTVLATYLKASAEDLVYIPNATFAVNAVARSLNLKPGDEILATDHEYGACDKAWEFICSKSGASYKRQPVSIPATPEEMLAQIWSGVTERTRLIFTSHITSPTAQDMPVAELCALARQAGILTLIDGAHAPGQIPLNLEALGADFYTGNCHKWMLSPKGAGFLYARKDAQPILEPLVVSWGWQSDEHFTTGSTFVDCFQWRGTDDPSACLAVPAAIDFMREHNWESVQGKCHTLLSQALERITALTGFPQVYLEDAGIHQMGVVQLPQQQNLRAFKQRLYDEHRIEIPCIEWGGRHWLRISVQGYNSQENIDCLVIALDRLLR